MPIEKKARYNLLETIDDDKYDSEMFRYTLSSSDYIKNSIKPQVFKDKVKYCGSKPCANKNQIKTTKTIRICRFLDLMIKIMMK